MAPRIRIIRYFVSFDNKPLKSQKKNITPQINLISRCKKIMKPKWQHDGGLETRMLFTMSLLAQVYLAFSRY
jgi:hypothetical protein